MSPTWSELKKTIFFTSSIPVAQIRKSPYICQSYSVRHTAHDEIEPSDPIAPVLVHVAVAAVQATIAWAWHWCTTICRTRKMVRLNLKQYIDLLNISPFFLHFSDSLHCQECLNNLSMSWVRSKLSIVWFVYY